MSVSFAAGEQKIHSPVVRSDAPLPPVHPLPEQDAAMNGAPPASDAQAVPVLAKDAGSSPSTAPTAAVGAAEEGHKGLPHILLQQPVRDVLADH